MKYPCAEFDATASPAPAAEIGVPQPLVRFDGFGIIVFCGSNIRCRLQREPPNCSALPREKTAMTAPN